MARVSLRQLEYFVAVAEIGSFRRAAEVLYVAQPSLSSQIGMLEHEIGGALLNRHARGVSLTPAGRIFLREAKTTLASVDRAVRHSRLALEGSAGEIHFATVHSIAAGLVPRALTAWRSDRPGALATMQEFRSATELERSTAMGLHDFAIGPLPDADFAHLEPLGAEEFVIVLPGGDEALASPVVNLAELARRPWVLFRKEHGLSIVMDTIFALHGIHPSGAVFTSQTDVAVNLAIAGLGPTIVPSNVVPEHLSGFCRSFEKPYMRELFVYSMNPKTSLADGFIQCFKDVLAGR
ncbi:LysR family transcriptional regulator [Acrocarpospora catenulata]|uniref:LysR family transcriptional regulator n=1 Tax=Acrocarpospora catenulata TaxID=2836182 RepID=UPI001BD950CA|nr:LysR family transcriptional regulator [Acrocarpospora catenulata]